MRQSRKIALAVAAGSACVGLLFFGPLDHASAHRVDDREVATKPVECSRVETHTERTTPVVAKRGLQQDIALTVKPTALIRVDRKGKITAAATNTGCAPRQGDDVFVVRPDGSITPSSSSNFVNRKWTGNFSVPGVYVAQRGSQSERGIDDDR
jgi:hypothetical protein